MQRPSPNSFQPFSRGPDPPNPFQVADIERVLRVALVNSAYRFLGRAAPATQPDEPALDDEIMGSRMQRTRIGTVFA